ncbi:sulfite oxidase heme-binding subunit YedZ [Comamonas aquatica]|jgi:sulfoxide reductase heme-binding subunit YedZ|uniref:sulfite oxidase heme-binding subunit YedZ n=1 Tax=Comamonas aquatica TaxID=225991 RepID=UPI002447BE17|nr:sulfoxide reductase heme-binding subunit YedZ [Comamonas aquatica]MDH0202662.1 sulfoxide reductase heme-binding subunit YedZ [Comamonas aquatica]MDH0371196.1 sulfoxide reductase heme-binding subunit YedZ [Comamonas aquatica]MDH0381055.1 sulfoxide reductase heme-binding subunit YedZ [Comamonas aquatica]MDH0429227.1 sulfoxide reductase heme-binding subunit YedZ [Comamonas aquatica]MDH0900191.1 sulfoxide reductase heme-binding subunit YedZ [Comamonas aquatica]
MSLSLKGLQRVALHLLCLVPVLWLFTLAATDGLGANPAEALLRDLGLWALRFVCLALAVTPLRVWLGWTRLAAYRRMLGLYAFFYGSLHWLCYLLLDMGLDWAAVLEDLAKRPFILVGTLAWGILLVLAITSIPRLIRRMGGKRWQALHRAVYAAAALAVLHFWWMRAGKNNLAEVGVYLAIVAALLLARVLHRYTKGRRIGRPRQPAR